MAAVAKPEGLVVAIVGGGADSRRWASILGERGFRVVQGPDLSALLPHRPVLTLIFAEPRDAPEAARQVAGLPSPPPSLSSWGPATKSIPTRGLCTR